MRYRRFGLGHFEVKLSWMHNARRTWFTELETFASQNVVKFIVGNKTDKVSQCQLVGVLKLNVTSRNRCGQSQHQKRAASL